MKILLAVIAIAILVAVLAYFAVMRGRKTVRAYIYLMQTDGGMDIGQANDIAGSVSTNYAGEFRIAALNYCRTHFRGNQLDMIKEARSRGFRQ